MKKIIGIIGTLLIAIGLIGCSGNGKEETKKSSDGKLMVTVSIYPLEQFTKMIGGDKVDIKTLVGPGQEPHDFELKPTQLKDLTNSTLFICNGLGMETWLNDVKGQIDNSKTTTIDASKGVKVIKDGDKTDPHVWLSLKEATVQADNIKNALIEKDPSNKQYYEKNYEKLKKEFSDLNNEYKPKFEKLKNKDFVTGHAAFGYLCREFGLTQKSISDLFADGEPTPKKLEELAAYCKKNKIKTVFSESLASPKASETLAREAGAKVEKIYTLESLEDNKTYLEGMKYDLDVIYKCLQEEN